MWKIAVLFLVVFAAGCSDRDARRKDFVARTVVFGERSYGYQVFVPKNRNPNEKLPVMLYLHGSGSSGDDNVTQIDNFHAAIVTAKDKLNFIVVLPQCRPGVAWASSEMAGYALAALEAAVNEFNGDRESLYLAGFSLGGYGAWHLAASNPGKFAAIVPVAGGVDADWPMDPQQRQALVRKVGEIVDSRDPYKSAANEIGKTSVWVFHGAKDESVSVEFSRKMVAALRAVGNRQVKYTEYPDEGHLIFGKAIDEPGLIEWLNEQRLGARK